MENKKDHNYSELNIVKVSAQDREDISEEKFVDKNYTNKWIVNFGKENVIKYDNKFKIRFDKNIVHNQQVKFIRRYLKPEMYWCDFPIGTGRLMRELKSDKMLGIDKSPAFIEHNRQQGIKVVEGDLFNNPFINEFDLVTSLHTIFAFKDFRKILREYIKSLKKGGILIVDIVNAHHVKSLKASSIKHSLNSGMTKSEIIDFFQKEGCKVIEIMRHSFWDNNFLINWKKKENKLSAKIKNKIWRICNRLYYKIFIFKLFLEFIEKIQPEYMFRKYLVAVKKL